MANENTTTKYLDYAGLKEYNKRIQEQLTNKVAYVDNSGYTEETKDDYLKVGQVKIDGVETGGEIYVPKADVVSVSDTLDTLTDGTTGTKVANIKIGKTGNGKDILIPKVDVTVPQSGDPGEETNTYTDANGTKIASVKVGAEDAVDIYAPEVTVTNSGVGIATNSTGVAGKETLAKISVGGEETEIYGKKVTATVPKDGENAVYGEGNGVLVGTVTVGDDEAKIYTPKVEASVPTEVKNVDGEDKVVPKYLSGTEIASVTIAGTETKIYAPAAAEPPVASIDYTPAKEYTKEEGVYTDGVKVGTVTFDNGVEGDPNKQKTFDIVIDEATKVDVAVNDNIKAHTGTKVTLAEVTINDDAENKATIAVPMVTADTYTEGTKTADGVSGLMSSADKTKLDNIPEGDTIALKSEIVGIYKYKGTVNDMDALTAIANPSAGDTYNVKNGLVEDGVNYAWVVDNEDTKVGHWDALGLNFQVATITNEEIAALWETTPSQG